MSTAEALENIKLSVRSARYLQIYLHTHPFRQHAYLGFYEESIKAFNKGLESIRR